MAFIIPNATDTASGAKFENLDQAEPDSLDFEMLGNVGRSGVVSGCEVTALPASNTSVALSSGVVVVDGKPYTVAGSSSYALPTAPTDSRFDLIVARLFSGSVSVVTVTGNDNAVNPAYPPSTNTITSATAFDGSIHIDLSTDVVLAAVYRQGSQNITTSRIADKRQIVISSIVGQGSTTPSSSAGVTGEFYFKTGVAQGSTASGVYVKDALGSWVELAQNTGPQVPVGSLIPWLGTTTVPSGYLEANGAVVSRTTYSELFDAIGTKYGAGDGSSTFGLPNLNGKHLKGTTSTSTVGNTTGSDTITLTTAQLPSHSHSISHTHAYSHSHGISHNHSVSSANQSASHSHSGTTANNGANHTHTAISAGSHNHTLNGANANDAGSHSHNASVNATFEFRGNTGFSPNGASVFFAGAQSGVATNTSNNYYWGNPLTFNGGTNSAGTHSHSVNAANTVASGDHTHNTNSQSANHTHTFNTNTQSDSHSHTITVNAQTTTNTSSQNTSTSGDSSAANTGNTGTASSVTIVPSSFYVRWLIRATGTTNATAQDGSDILSEALEEVVTVELVGSGSLPASSTGVAYYRMPWAATLTAVKANVNSTTTTAITVDVNEAGTSVLSTEITIDAGESSSLTAATPAVISDSAIANDALLTFDIDSASTGDSGPLTVTLYFTRSA